MDASDKDAKNVVDPLKPNGPQNLVRKHQQYKARSHTHVPRWLRMALRTSLMMVLMTLPVLCMREPSFKVPAKYQAYSAIFMLLGSLMLPMWEPFIGNLVLVFTLLTPIALAPIGISYGLFLAWPNAIFLMCTIVFFAALVLTLSELKGLPVALLSVFVVLYTAGVITYLNMPAMAATVASLLCICVLAAAFIVVTCSWLVFPEFCIDQVFRSHSEALEQLLHLAHYTSSSDPPPLKPRPAASRARLYGSSSRHHMKLRHAVADLDDSTETWTMTETEAAAAAAWQHAHESGGLQGQLGHKAVPHGAFGGVGEETMRRVQRMWGLPPSPSSLNPKQAAAGGGVGGALGHLALTRGQKAQRAWVRVLLALSEGKKCEAGAMAELVVCSVGPKRVVVPVTPLLPCWKRHLNKDALMALRHAVVETGLQLYKMYISASTLSAQQVGVLDSILPPSSRAAMHSELVLYLQQLVDTFPQDYHPPPLGCLSEEGLERLSGQVEAFDKALDSLLDQQQHRPAADRPTLSEKAAQAAAEGWVGAADDSGFVAAVRNSNAQLGDEAAGQQLTLMQLALLRSTLRRLVASLRLLHHSATELMDGMVRAGCC